MPDRPLRILVFGNLPPYVMGGAENQVARLVEAWAAAGAKVEVAGHRLPGGLVDIGQYRIRSYRIHNWARAGRILRGLTYMLSLWSLAWRTRRDFDIAYCRGLTDAALALALGRALGIVRWRLLVVPINAGGTGDAHFVRSLPFWQWWCGILDKNVSAFNLINSSIGRDLDGLELLSPARRSIPNGIPMKERLSHAPDFSCRRLIWTGRLEFQKGLDLLLPALAACRRDGTRFVLDLFGEGSERDFLEAQSVELGLDDVVTFHGSRATQQLRRELGSADVFVLPSRYEGMSNSALEAMEAGLPVLCTQCGGIDHAIAEGAGWTCRPGDADHLLEVLRIMFGESPTQWIQRGETGRELVESRFTIESVAAANLKLMEQLIAAGGACES
jgi:glycosyltransferase involved in cell wall biosynthesis